MFRQFSRRFPNNMSLRIIAKRGTSTEEFSSVWDVDAETASHICSASDPLAAYCCYVRELDPIELEPVYAADDIDGAGLPVTWMQYGRAVEHADEVCLWAHRLESRGFILEVLQC